MPVRQGAATRTLMDLTVGSQKAMRERERRDAEMGLSEIMQQFQVTFKGTAGNMWGFSNANLTFEFPFYFAPGQRDPQFDRPHFWFGAEVAPAVAVSATVTAWTIDADNGAVIGATVAIGVCAAVPETGFSGIVHLTFQGFSALAEDETDING